MKFKASLGNFDSVLKSEKSKEGWGRYSPEVELALHAWAGLGPIPVTKTTNKGTDLPEI